MSTLKVNTIEPYSGGTVSITGYTPTNATSASYATVAENLTPGDKNHSGVIKETFAAPVGGQTDVLTVTGAVTEGLSYPTYTVGIQDYGGADFGDAFVTEIFGPGFAYGTGHSISGKGVFVNVAPNGGGTAGKLRIEDIGGAASKATIQATNVQIDGATNINGSTIVNNNVNVNGSLTVTGSVVQANSGLNVNGQTNLANTTTNGLLNTNNGIRVSGSNIVQHSGFPGQQAHIFQNENFFSEFYGTDLRWSQTGGTSGLVMGELNTVVLSLNSFTPDFSTDNLFEVKSNLASGTTIGDWAGFWMTVPEAGTPVMKRGLTIEGLGDYADDAAAATGGVPVNGVYRTGSVLKIRVV